jgi:hypothetical protein
MEVADVVEPDVSLYEFGELDGVTCVCATDRSINNARAEGVEK